MKTTPESLRDNNYLTWEVFLIGGFSVLCCFAFWLFVDKSSSLFTISITAASLAFIINHPHFLSSYMLLYWDHRHELLKKPKYIWASVIAPLILFSLLVVGVVNKNVALMGHIITAMFFFVGWHYVKQIFGCVIVSSVHRQIFYSASERKTILFSLYSIWFFNWVQSHIGASTFDFYGIKHASFGMPEYVRTAGFYWVGLSVFSVVWMHVKKYIDKGSLPSPPAVAAYTSLLVWYLPMFSHPGFGYMIPFFHSMQYLVFVGIYKKNEAAFFASGKPAVEQRQVWMKKFVGYLLCAGILGSLFFEWLPKSLDQMVPLSGEGLGPSPWLASFLLFINIHHYFIDNVIWRSDNASVKKYLFTKPEENAKPREWPKSA